MSFLTVRVPPLRSAHQPLCFACRCLQPASVFFFFNDTATTEIYTLSLHDALPIYHIHQRRAVVHQRGLERGFEICRSEEHTSELQSHLNLVCRLLLEKKKA